jgi:hypothetical protein
MAVDLDAYRVVPGREYSWSVRARNRHGEARSEARSFRIDPSLGSESPPLAEAPEPDATGILVRAPLRGDAVPSHGLLQDLRGAEPAPGPSGDPGTALRLDGETGRVRYAIPWFPDRDYSVAIRVSLRSFPRGRIGQIFSSWAGSMDDPLRITIDGGRLFARIEARGTFSTEGVEIAVDRWVHVAAVKAGNRLLLYVDGEVRSSGAVPEEVVSRAENVAVGGNPNYAGNECLDATLADFTLYARALSADEVRALAR